MYFESHAHLDDKRFRNDQEDVIKKIQAAGVSKLVNVGINTDSMRKSIELSEKYDFIYASLGVHPHYADSVTDRVINFMKEKSKAKKVVAIGEIGLDFFRNISPKEVQIKWFKEQLELAKKVNLPVIIHSRDADEACFLILKEANLPKKGVIHCYSGSAELADKYVKMGYKIGIGGVVTYNNAKKIVQTVEKIPMESILIETDCPYLTPEPNRKDRNDPSYLKYIVDKIADIKKISSVEVAHISMDNSVKFFGC